LNSNQSSQDTLQIQIDFLLKYDQIFTFNKFYNPQASDFLITTPDRMATNSENTVSYKIKYYNYRKNLS